MPWTDRGRRPVPARREQRNEGRSNDHAALYFFRSKQSNTAFSNHESLGASARKRCKATGVLPTEVRVEGERVPSLLSLGQPAQQDAGGVVESGKGAHSRVDGDHALAMRRRKRSVRRLLVIEPACPVPLAASGEWSSPSHMWLSAWNGGGTRNESTRSAAILSN